MIITKDIISQWTDTKTFHKALKLMDTTTINVHSLHFITSDLFIGTGVELSGLMTIDRKITYCRIALSLDGPVESFCDDFQCRNNDDRLCLHTTLFLLKAIPLLKDYPLSLSSPVVSWALQKAALALDEEEQEPVHLEAVLEEGHYQLRARFKIGRNKMYFIKNLKEFIDRFENHDNFSYGKDFSFTHQETDIFEEDLPIFHLISKYVKDYKTYKMTDDNEEISLKKDLVLSGSFLDDFFDIFQSKTLEIKQNRKACQVSFVNASPEIPIQLTENNYGQYLGVAMQKPKMMCLAGSRYKYIYMNYTLYRTDRQFAQSVYPFFYNVINHYTDVIMDQEDMKSFMTSLYPILSQTSKITAENFALEKYAPPQTLWKFYFDYQNQAVTLKPMVTYGDRTYQFGIDDIEGYRDLHSENKVVRLINRHFKIDDQNVIKTSESDDAIYEFLKNGLPLYHRLGEVYISDKLKNINIHYAPKVSVGVRLESNLLDIKLNLSDMDIKELQEVLISYRHKQKYHRLRSGQFMQLEDNSSIDVLAEMSETLNLKDLASKSVKIPAFRVLYLDRLLGEREDFNYSRDRHVRALLRDFKTIEDSDYSLPESMQNILRPYQKLGYQWLKTMDHYHFGGILADDMGLGKTVQMIAFLKDYYSSQKTKPSLIVTPASLVYNWESEFLRFAPEMKINIIAGSANDRLACLKHIQNDEILITSYDLLKRDISLYENLSFAYEILDEAQFIKNSGTLQAKAVKAIQSDQRFALTGTPIENRLSELWSIFDFLMPGFLYPYKTFKAQFETEIVKRKNPEASRRLQRMVGPFILRRLKKDVLKDLPDKIEEVSVASLEGEQKKLYLAYATNVKNRLNQQNEDDFKKNKIQILADLLRLRQLCCDPSLVYENYQGGSAKLEQCMALVESCIDGGHKILLFSQFTSMLDILKKELNKRQIPFYLIQGETKKEQRVRDAEAFNHDDTPVFLVSLKAGGTGLNLTGADIVIHYDPWWNVAVQNQATDRVHRIGQKRVVTVYQMIAKDTIEEKIVELQKTKQELVNEILTGDNTSLSSLSKEELLEILS